VPAWLIWAIAAVLLSVGEIFTPGLFFLGPVALGALAATVVALVGLGVAAQLLVFIGGSIATVAFLRPIARRHVHMPAALRTGTAALEGTKAVVLQRVDVNGGRVRIGGEEWSARAYMDDQVLEPGTRVEVVKIEGATALVYE
jgi:membrane protein implicated in regulation of membrane protease activity